VRQQNTDRSRDPCAVRTSSAGAELEIESTFLNSLTWDIARSAASILAVVLNLFCWTRTGPPCASKWVTALVIPIKQLQWTIGGLAVLLLIRLTYAKGRPDPAGVIDASIQDISSRLHSIAESYSGRSQNNYTDLLACAPFRRPDPPPCGLTEDNQNLDLAKTWSFHRSGKNDWKMGPADLSQAKHHGSSGHISDIFFDNFFTELARNTIRVMNR